MRSGFIVSTEITGENIKGHKTFLRPGVDGDVRFAERYHARKAPEIKYMVVITNFRQTSRGDNLGDCLFIKISIAMNEVFRQRKRPQDVQALDFFHQLRKYGIDFLVNSQSLRC